MAIPDEEVARVRAATDLAALIGEHTALKRVGRRYVGLCPFHSERSPSFSVNAEEGLYYCFGCQVRGDAITFVRAIDGCDFVEAVERLAARSGITLHDDADPAAAAQRGRRQELMEVVAAAAAFYHERLLSHPDAKRARQYLRNRGYDGEVVRRFSLGYAPSGGEELIRHVQKGSLLRAAGLAHDTVRGRLQDTFRERVIFPIFDPAGRPIALGGRILPAEMRSGGPEAGPKYRNSAESAIYQKRRTLYGLNWAKTEIASSGEAIVCEGYTDVIGFFSAGVPRAVATCGTALTEDHFRLLSRFAKRIVLAFDADSAGQNAAARLYEWERRHDLELAVARLPEGSDPGELAQRDPDALAAAVAEAKPFLGFQLDAVFGAANLSTPEGQARALREALAAIAEHPIELVRDGYLRIAADRTRQDLDGVRPLLAAARREAERRAAEPDRPPARPREVAAARAEPASGHEAPAGEERRVPNVEASPAERAVTDGMAATRPRPPAEGPRPGRDALLLAIHRPGEVTDYLQPACFVDPVQKEAFAALLRAAHLHEAIEDASPEASELLSRLAASGDADELEVAGTVVAAVRYAANAALEELQAETRLALASDADRERQRQLQETTNWLRSALVHLNELLVSDSAGPLALEASQALLAWLSQRQA